MPISREILITQLFSFLNSASFSTEATEKPSDGKTITAHGKNGTLSVSQVIFNKIIQIKDMWGLNIAMYSVNTVGALVRHS